MNQWQGMWRLLMTVPGFACGRRNLADLVNALVADREIELHRDLPYGPAPRQKLDLYRPVASPAGNAAHPVLVFYYGGSWQRGRKEDYLFLAQSFAARGFVVVVPDYRLYPEIRYPAFLEDGAIALAWVQDNIAALGGDPARIAVLGHSAGAYIAVMLALDGRWLGGRRRRIAGVAGLAGPYDFLPITDRAVEAIFSTASDLSRTQPISHAGPGAPPLFLGSGLADKVVSPGNTTRLAMRIRERGGSVAERLYPRLGHVTLVGALAHPLNRVAPVLDDLVGFLTQLPRTGVSGSETERLIGEAVP